MQHALSFEHTQFLLIYLFFQFLIRVKYAL